MIVYSDSTLWTMVAYAVTCVTVVTCAIGASFLISRQFIKAARVLVLAIALFGTYVLGFVALTPQRTVTIGESYCQDIWCIGLDRVTALPQAENIEYKIDVRIFSDANRVQTSAKGYTIYLADEKGRRFPLLPDASVVPYDTILSPRQSVQTVLTFVVAADAKRLYLMGDAGKPPPSWLRFLGRLYSGGDSRPVLIRVT